MHNLRKALVGGRLIDGTGRLPVDDSVVVIDSSTIQAVGEKGEVDVPKDAERINVEGKTIIPGLIDAHLHFSGSRPGEDRAAIFMVEEPMRAIRAATDARSMLCMGYTGARDCGSTVGISLKKAIEEGSTPGPRIVSSGPFVHNTFGHIGASPIPLNVAAALGQTYSDGVDECLKAVRSRLREGSDFIKIASGLYGESRKFPKCMASYTFEEIKAIADEAHRAYTIVASHCQGKEGIMTSLKAGVDTIEHGSEFDDECARLMKEKNKILVPTVFIQTTVLDLATMKNRYSDRVKESLRKGYYDSVRYAMERGVRIASGSDFSGGSGLGALPMGKNAAELEALVKAGMSPMQAIVSATKTASEAMMMEDRIGTLEREKLADIVVVNGNPLEDIAMLQDENRISMVLKGGEIVVNRT